MSFHGPRSAWVRPLNYADSATQVALAAARNTVGDDAVRSGCKPSMASEDFAFMARVKPAAYIWMGVDGATASAPLHNPHYDFNDDALVKAFSRAA